MAGDYSTLDALVAKFRAGSPNIAKSFDQVKGHLKRHDGEVDKLMGALGSIPSTAKISLSFSGNREPTADDDASTGVASGAIWVDTTAGFVYLCTSAAPGQASWVQIGQEESVPPPPPATGTLTWAPPALTSPVTVTLTNANKATALKNGAGRDVRVICAEPLSGIASAGAIIVPIEGWRNVVWIGGEINATQTQQNEGIIPRDCTGTVHLEGIYVHGQGIADAMCNRLGGPNQIMQIQNCRNEVHYSSTEHADCFQTQACSLKSLRFDMCTFRTDYQGMMLHNEFAYYAGSKLEEVIIKRLNYIGYGATTVHFLFKAWAENDSTTEARSPGLFTLVADASGDTVFMNAPTTGFWTQVKAAWVHPNVQFQNPFTGANFSVRRGSFLGSDANGEYVYFSDGTQVVPPGGATSGQTTLDCKIRGKLRVGDPPGGDWCPLGRAGMSYVSPGYA
jgi:hypothetical protein